MSARRAKPLCAYIADRERGCVAVDVHNCMAPETAHAEMRRTGLQGRLPEQALRHLVLSWPPGETPTEVEALGAGKKLLNRLGYGDHLALLGVHDDTAPGPGGTELPRRHVHIGLCVIHPVTLRAHTPELIRLAGDRICRELEIEHGWQIQRGPHVVREGHDGRPVIDRVYKDYSKLPASPPTQEAVSIGLRTGEPHLQQRAAGIGTLLRADLPAMRGWADWHRAMAAHGLVYEPRGGGAIVREAREGGQIAKASQFHRALAMAALVKTFGSYQPPPQAAAQEATARGTVERQVTEAARAEEAMGVQRTRQAKERQSSTPQAPEGDRSGSGGRGARPAGADGRGGSRAGERVRAAGGRRPRDQERRAAQREDRAMNRSALYAEWTVWKDERRAARGRDWKAVRSALRTRHTTEFRQAVVQNRAERAEALRGDWRGRGPRLNAMRSVIAAEQAGRIATLKDRHADERRDLSRRLRATQTARNDDWRSFLGEKALEKDTPGGRAARAFLKRESYRGGGADTGEDRPFFSAETDDGRDFQAGPQSPRPRDIRDVTWEIDEANGWVRYRTRDDGAHSFTDVGRRVVLNRRTDDDVRAALQLAAAKFGGQVKINGDAAFKARAARMARELGIGVGNDELSGLVARIDAEIRASTLKQDRERERAAAGIKRPPPAPEPASASENRRPPDPAPDRPETRHAQERAKRDFDRSAAVDGTGTLRRLGIRFEVEREFQARLRVHEDSGTILVRHTNAEGGYAGHELVGRDGKTTYADGCARGVAVFGSAETADRIVIVETALDALSRAQMDGAAVAARTLYVSTHGAPSVAQQRQIAAMAFRPGRHPTVEIATDDTAVGRAVAEALRAGLMSEGVQDRRITRTAPREMGWNQDLQAGHPAPGWGNPRSYDPRRDDHGRG